MRLLDVTDNVVGGRVTVTGQFSDGAGKRIVRGHVEGEDYSLVRAPAFAQILSLASLSGVGSMLSGTGIPFSGSTIRNETPGKGKPTAPGIRSGQRVITGPPIFGKKYSSATA